MNLRLYLNIILSILLLGIMVSCQNDDALCEGAKQSNVKLTLTLGEHASRTVINGTSTKENVMNTVHLFFYPSGAEEAADATFECLNITLPKPEGQTHDIELEIPVDKFKELFPNGNNSCQVYAIVNLPDVSDNNPDVLVDHELPANHSLESLKDNVILYAGDSFSNFVMDGLAEITLNNNKLGGTILVKRVAAKISLILNINKEVQIYEHNDAPNIDDKGDVIQKWIPAGNATISFRRGSKRTKLGSTPEGYLYTPNANDLINTDFITSDGGNGDTFYTYPTNWTNNENIRTHFILAVEWKQTYDIHWTETPSTLPTELTYYEVTANASGSYVERNHHYIINQEVSVLGSPHIEDPYELELTNGFTILDWGGIATEGSQSETTTEAEVNQLKYLVVDETSIKMNNTSSKIINFASSDPIELSSVLVKWDYIKTENSKVLVFPTTMSNPPVNTSGDISYEILKSNETPYDSDGKEVQVTNRIDGDYIINITIHNANPQEEGDRNYIEITHHLNNSMSPDADYTKYSIDFTVQHQDNDAYNETIKILQYPMLSIENDINYDYIYNDPNKRDDNSKGHTNENKGYVYVNGNNENTAEWDGVVGIAYTTNPNRYIISISALNEDGNKYIIGDPRISMEIGGLGTDLTGYYGTNSSSTSAQVISPQFMFASSYGGCPDSGLDQAEAERRCAAYQEDGYYAGRWRLPTKAEILYATQLSVWEVIPPLFSDGMNYWSAQGCVTIDGNTVKDNATTPSGQRVVRCVYDTWYWGKGHVAGSTKFAYKTSL